MDERKPAPAPALTPASGEAALAPVPSRAPVPAPLRHRIALVVLCLTAGVHLVVLVREQAEMPTPGYDHVIFWACLWLLVLWKVGSRTSGRGLGVVLLLLGTGFVHWWYRSWEKWRGMGGQMDFAEALRYLPAEAVLLVAGFFCLLVPSAPREREGEGEEVAACGA